MGLFGSHKTTTQNAISYLNSTTTNTLVQVNTSCMGQTNTSQNLEIDVGTSNEVMLACLAIPSIAANCGSLMSNGIVIDGVTQSANVVNIVSCKVDTNTVQALQSSLAAQIAQKMDQTDDAVGSAVKSLVTTFNNTSTNTTNTQDVKNFVTQNFTLQSTQTMVNTISTVQNQKIVAQNTNNTAVKNLVQSIQLQAMTDLLSSNQTTLSAMNTMDAATTQTTTQTTKGLTDLFSSLMGTVSTFIKSYAYAVIAVVCAICCCLVIIGIAFFATGGQKTLQQGITTAGDSFGPGAKLKAAEGLIGGK